MTDLALIFSMLGEAATKEIAVNRDAQGFDENKSAAKIGGKITGEPDNNSSSDSDSDIASVLGIKVTSLGPVRAKLIRKGMVYSPSHGDMMFTVPLFDEFMIRAIYPS